MMIKILIVDDNSSKVLDIVSTISGIHAISDDDIITASDIFTARKHLREKQFDILILDLLIPDRHGYEPKLENSLFILEELKESDDLYKPVHVIGLTEFEDARTKSLSMFESFLFHIIKYEQSTNTWKDYLVNCINYFINVRSNASAPTIKDYEYDLAIITALREPELKAVLKLNANWSIWNVSNDSTIYHIGKFSNSKKTLKVVAASQNQMGLTAAATLSCKIINTFTPKYIVNIGIAAGMSGIGNFGDILICDMSWEYNSGKILANEEGAPYIWPDPKSLPLNSYLKERFLLMATHSDILSKIKSNTDAAKPDTELKAIIGPLASGSSVIQCKAYIDSILKHNRKLIGIDMETFGIFYAANNSPIPQPTPFSLKSICDFADEHKGDNYQPYAAYTSAAFLYEFALTHL